MRSLVCALVACVLAQQPEQAHIAQTGSPSELSIDFMAHNGNCTSGFGVQVGTSPDLTAASFIPAYACDDFSSQESTSTFAVRVLLTGLVTGTKYYYVCGSPNLRTPWSRVYSFTHDSGALREGGPTAVVLADFGCVVSCGWL